MRPSGAGLENVHFLEYTFVLDIHCQHLGKMCQFGGCLSALRARGWRMCIFENIHLYWIYIANNWGKCVSLEGVCAPFRRGFGECAFSRIYTLPTIGENVSVGWCLCAIQVRECTFSRICIEHTLPTIGENVSVGGCLCALWVRGWRMCIF